MALSPTELAKRANLVFDDPSLLYRALTHRSYINEHPEALEDNERLEFLGDAAIDFVAAGWLYNRFPEMNEGSLTRLRSALVRSEQLGEFGRQLRLGDALLLGHGEEVSGGRVRTAMLCDAFEALVGALYLDKGIEAVWHFLNPFLEKAAARVLEGSSLVDARSQLQMWAQAELGETPHYRTIDSWGPDHDRHFVIEVSVGKRLMGKGEGKSKQEAAQQAAEDALGRAGYPSPRPGGR
jgi:ribonuclease-3